MYLLEARNKYLHHLQVPGVFSRGASGLGKGLGSAHRGAPETFEGQQCPSATRASGTSWGGEEGGELKNELRSLFHRHVKDSYWLLNFGCFWADQMILGRFWVYLGWYSMRDLAFGWTRWSTSSQDTRQWHCCSWQGSLQTMVIWCFRVVLLWRHCVRWGVRMVQLLVDVFTHRSRRLLYLDIIIYRL